MRIIKIRNKINLQEKEIMQEDLLDDMKQQRKIDMYQRIALTVSSSRSANKTASVSACKNEMNFSPYNNMVQFFMHPCEVNNIYGKELVQKVPKIGVCNIITQLNFQ